MKNLYCVFAVMLLLTSGFTANDPFIGTWILNPRRSKYPPGTCPKSMIISMEPVGKGIRYRSDAVFANGATAHAQYTADYNGREVIVTGNRGLLLPVSLKRSNRHTVIAYYSQGHGVAATSRRVISKDERWMTITTQSKDHTGKNVTVIGIYERKSEHGSQFLAKPFHRFFVTPLTDHE